MSIDKFDYAEPCCPLADGKDFYYPEKATPSTIPVDRVIARLDAFFAENDLDGAGKLLNYWLAEAVDVKDKRGELSILSELLGYYRKIGDAEKSSSTIARANEFLEELKLSDSVSGSTILLNIATNMKAFGDADKALPLYEKVLAVYEKNLPADDVKFGGLYNNYALSLVDCEEYVKAEKFYRKAIEIMKKQIDGLPDCAVSYVNLAVLILTRDPLDDVNADKALTLALDCLDDKSVTRNGYYAFVCDKCSAAFSECGWFAAANDLKNRARSIYERS